jgi:hypothetical protein
MASRFNGFSGTEFGGGGKTVQTVLFLAVAVTGLKPGVNEIILNCC